MCKELDGSQKTFHGTVARRAGTQLACLAYPGRAYVPSVLVYRKSLNI